MSDESTVGMHRLWIEGDILICRYEGEVSVAELTEINRILREAVAERGVRYFMMDISRLPPPSPEARRWLASPKHAAQVRSAVIFGASALMRIVVSIVQRAMGLLKHTPTSPMRMFGSEADARAWIDEDRARAEATGVAA